jgi:hypothetical protein
MIGPRLLAKQLMPIRRQGKLNYYDTNIPKSPTRSSTNNHVGMGSSALCQHLYTDHFQPPPVCESPTVVSASHTSLLIVIHQLAKHTGLWQVREQTQVDTGFRVSFTSQRSAFACAKGNHVAWPGEI